ncbi:hypothetical protein [Halarcobacter anaerophilus]|uniref:hypothetical protein n=1 Tax=Halarcobacter anaerophilus TaxID=877500 RepID=UPI0005CA568E|nr:hypothetical protein [Halarcobacter anaerophilus]
MSREEKVFYNGDSVGHVIAYTTDKNTPIKNDPRSRWAYLIVNKKEAKEILSGEETSKDEILDKLEAHFFSYIKNAIKEEESLVRYQTLSSCAKYSDYKKIVLISSSIATSLKGKKLLLMAKQYMKGTRTLKAMEEQTLSLLELNRQKAKQHLKEELAKNKFIKVTRATLANSKDNKEPYAMVSVPYVYNFEDNRNIDSKLIATVKQGDMISSLIDPYQLSGKWTDVNKNEILEHDMSNKDEEVYFYIQTVNIPDGTIGKLTLMDYDYFFDDVITSLNFTINNNEAFILIEFDKIKHNIIKALKAESKINDTLDESELINQAQEHLELYMKIQIKDLNIKKDLAKEKYLKLSTEYVKIGTRSLGNLPYPDSMLPLPIRGIGGVETLLDTANLEPIHQHIAFKDDQNIGFTKAYAQNNEDINGRDYGMLKTDPEMSGIPNTKVALSKYAWDKYYCDEDTFKEAIYLTINEHKYAVSDLIAQMNERDVRRQSLRGEEIDFTFTPIIRYTPPKGIRYSLLSENCQAFVSRVQNRYKLLEKQALPKESLS